MKLGLATFADVGSDVTRQQRMRQLLEEAELADQLGLDVFAIGEHHRPDYLVSSPAVVLGAIAARTTFIESFPLFGYDLDDYDELFAEKLELLLEIRRQSHVTWSGRHRAPLNDAGVWPRPVQDPLPVWVAVGGSPQSVIRAAALGLPLTIAIIGGEPERFEPPVRLYRDAWEAAGRDPAEAQLAINTHAFVGDTSARADSAFAASYLQMMNRIGRERGWPPAGREQYEALRSPRGALAVGSVEQVAEKILFEHELFGHQRYIGQMSAGAVAHADVMRSIELFGTEVAPLVRAEVARRTGDAADAATVGSRAWPKGPPASLTRYSASQRSCSISTAR
jgi:alkanesulfonate monooxygenase SsuD/methylene tetrahydromethanopterin reductase-like flavin-dependent oxidoreductase (luciferase family)